MDVLEGAAGFGVATAGISDLRVDGLGDPFCVTEATVKCHACCGHTFAAIDAALELRAGGVHAEDVTRVEIETYRVATEVAGHANPANPAQARFSLAYTVAVALVLGSVRLDAFAPDALAHPVIRTPITTRPGRFRTFRCQRLSPACAGPSRAEPTWPGPGWWQWSAY